MTLLLLLDHHQVALDLLLEVVGDAGLILFVREGRFLGAGGVLLPPLLHVVDLRPFLQLLPGRLQAALVELVEVFLHRLNAQRRYFGEAAVIVGSPGGLSAAGLEFDGRETLDLAAEAGFLGPESHFIIGD